MRVLEPILTDRQWPVSVLPMVLVFDGGSITSTDQPETFLICVAQPGGSHEVTDRCPSYADARRAARQALQRHQAAGIVDLTDWYLP